MALLALLKFSDTSQNIRSLRAVFCQLFSICMLCLYPVHWLFKLLALAVTPFQCSCYYYKMLWTTESNETCYTEDPTKN